MSKLIPILIVFVCFCNPVIAETMPGYRYRANIIKQAEFDKNTSIILKIDSSNVLKDELRIIFETKTSKETAIFFI